MPDTHSVLRRTTRHEPQDPKCLVRRVTKAATSATVTFTTRMHSSARHCHDRKPERRATTLPCDLWTLMLPFLTWRDTTAMSSVCSVWKRVVTEAKQWTPEWRTTVVGPSVNSLESLQLLQRNHLNWADTRFAPNVVLLAAASMDSGPWQRGRYWVKAITALETARLLPPRCTVVGVFTRHIVQRTEATPGNWSAVELWISVAHFPDTTIEVAQFDRKDLRQCPRRVALDYPFSVLQGNTSPCFMLFGVNNHSARRLVPMVEKWHPGAAMIGTVSPFTDRCVPLAVSCNDALVNHHQRQPRKHTRATQRRHVSFPSTTLLRLDGIVGFRSFSASGYHPITPVMRCEHVHVADDPMPVTTYKVVSVQGSPCRPLELINPSDRLCIQQGRALSIFACAESEPLDHLVASSTNEISSPARITRVESVVWAQDGFVSQPALCWPEGAYGVLAVHHPPLTLPALRRALDHTRSSLSAARERAFGAFVVADAVDANDVRHVCTKVFHELPLAGWIATSSIGPLALVRGLFPPGSNMVQTHSTCGAIFHVKSRDTRGN